MRRRLAQALGGRCVDVDVDDPGQGGDGGGVFEGWRLC